eukprot:gene9153-9926_t
MRNFRLTFLFLLLGVLIEFLDGSRENIAVCVTGQIARWMPERHIPNLIDNNVNYFFSFFFVFQLKNSHHPVAYHKQGPTNASDVATAQLEDALARVSDLYTRQNSELANIRHITPYTELEWRKYLNLLSPNQKLDRIWQFSENQKIILNIYRNQQKCLTDIMNREEERNKRYDYLFYTREDLYYFHPLNLSIPINLLKQKHQVTMKGKKPSLVPSCHLVAKDCLSWGGVSMRLELVRREEADNIFGSRLKFYRTLYTSNITVKNPELFEFQQLKEMKYQLCKVSVEVMGITVARPSLSQPDGVCFLSHDIQYTFREWHQICVPVHFLPKIADMRCSNYTFDYETHLRRSMNQTERLAPVDHIPLPSESNRESIGHIRRDTNKKRKQDN